MGIFENFKYNIYIPSGNPTILVEGICYDKERRKEINDYLLNKYNFVEQVGFVNGDINKPMLLMSGGEFCGNAARSAIYYYLKGKDGELDIDILGVNVSLKGGINGKNVWVNMPIDNISIDKGINNTSIIKMPGISHIICDYKENLKLEEYSKFLIKSNNLLDEPAVGVMYIKRINSNIYLTPYVYVQEINTWFKETACGSGTTAVGIYETFRLYKSVSLDIVQPSNNIINIKTILYNDKVIKATISGCVEFYNE